MLFFTPRYVLQFYIIPRSKFFLEELVVAQLLKKFGTQRFITVVIILGLYSSLGPLHRDDQ